MLLAVFGRGHVLARLVQALRRSEQEKEARRGGAKVGLGERSSAVVFADPETVLRRRDCAQACLGKFRASSLQHSSFRLQTCEKPKCRAAFWWHRSPFWLRRKDVLDIDEADTVRFRAHARSDCKKQST